MPIKANKNSVSSSLEIEFKPTKISISKRGKQLSNFDIVAIVEWLELKDDEKDLFQSLRAIAFLLKNVKGLESLFDETIDKMPRFFNEESMDDSSITSYVDAVSEVIEETDLLNSFLEESNITVECENSIVNKKMLIDVQEYLSLKQLSTKKENEPHKPNKPSIKPIKKEEPLKESSGKESSKDYCLKTSKLIKVLVRNYNNGLKGGKT